MREEKPALLCVPVGENRARHLSSALARSASLADIVELRLDYLPGIELDAALRNLDELMRASTRPLIMTLRPVEQGGMREIDVLYRLAFWVEHFLYNESYKGFADIEWDLVQLIAQSEDERWKKLDWSRVICSYHNFVTVPAGLEQIYEQMAQTPARILKIAVRAERITDCIPVFRLHERARKDERELICIAMGQTGTATRILAPVYGSPLTYGVSEKGCETAPGQLTAGELRELYRVGKLDRRTEVTGLVGAPTAQSLSPHMHNAAFAARGLNSVYIPFEVDDVRAFIERMAHPRSREIGWRLRGLSVTAPYKRSIMELLDRVDAEARDIGAVNTVVVCGDELHGYNTDAEAFLAPLRRRSETWRDARCAIIGTGGAARSCLFALKALGADVTVFARSIEKGRLLASEFGVRAAPLEGAQFRGYDLVANATTLGARGAQETLSPATATQLEGARLVYDLVYNPAETLMMREARRAGCDCLGGLEMLTAQAAAQFKLWYVEDAPVDVMRAAALAALAKQEPAPGI